MAELFSTTTNIKQLSDMFDKANAFFYEGKLSKPNITIGVIYGERHSRYTPDVYSITNSKKMSEITLDKYCLRTNNIENILLEMLFCMAKHYAYINKIPITSRKDCYYNKKFYNIAITHGMNCERSQNCGYNSVSLNKQAHSLLSQYNWGFVMVSEGRMVGYSNTHHRTYRCPVCGDSCRATKEISFSCNKCNKPLELVLK